MMHFTIYFLLFQVTLAFPASVFTRSSSFGSRDQLSHSADVDFLQWASPGPGDVRAPCPALNSLANHGILPRNGKEITLPILIKALKDGMNVDPDLATLFFTGATAFGLVKNGSFDLDFMDEHNAIEHDGSLSRADASTGDNHSFNQTIFNTYTAFLDGHDVATPSIQGKARMFRILTEKQRDPFFTYGPTQQLISNGESSLILSVLGNILTGEAPVDFIKIWFQEERLPYIEGWRPSKIPINIPNTLALVGVIAIASGEALEDPWTVINQILKNGGSI